MMEPLKIYLGDLTYDTVAVSTEAHPLNIGYIASFCIKQFGSKVDIKLFKYIPDLEKAIEESPPDIMGLSNYCWSQNVSQEMFKMLKTKNPNSLRVWGGPNFPLDFPSQKKFLEKVPDVDIYVPIDGEVGFSNIVERALNADSKENIRNEMITKPLDGCIIKDINGKLLFTIADTRIKDLHEIPSPYTTGLLDRFFDGKLVPMLQTNRGCPFTCTFCTDGNDAVMKVVKFNKERIKDDIVYMAKHVPKNTHSMFISDLNFGMLPGDLETCHSIRESQKLYNYPQRILATTGKNNKEGVLSAIKLLNSSVVLSMSVQSMDEQVLKNIRRENISVEKMMSLSPAIKESGLLTTAEIILSLPGENYQTHLESIRKLVLAGMDDIVIHTCMLLPGSEMDTPKERKKWEFYTKFRILPRDFATLANGKRVCEIEEVVVGSKDMTFDEYVKLRLVGFALWMTNKGILYDPIIKFLREQNIDVFELFHQMIERENTAPTLVKNMIEKYRKATIEELYDSSEQILKLIQNDDFYNELLEGKGAINVMQYHHAAVLTECMDEWTEYVIQTATQLLKENNKFDNEIQRQFETIANFCRGSCHNPLGKDRLETNPEYELAYNVNEWIKGKNNLKNFKLPSPIKVIFKLTKEQYKVIQDTLDMYGHGLIGKTKALKMVAQHHLWRTHEHPTSEKNYNSNSSSQRMLLMDLPGPAGSVFSV